MNKFAMCAAIVASAGFAAQAQTISNGDFTGNAGLFGDVDVWGPAGSSATHTCCADPNSFILQAQDDFFAFMSVGQNPVDGSSEEFYQTAVGTIREGVTYTFSMWVTDGGSPGGDFGLFIGSFGTDGDFSTLDVLSSTGPITATDGWAQYSTTYIGQLADVGKSISVGVVSDIIQDVDGDGREDIWMDNATFVPAPGAIALMGLGGMVAGRRRRA